ncbi:hypothetical protein CDAR_286051 [Caerostris darwini]|uniref:Uncharacterized protein n=1 Tax=Caerostris darwini TaxID=1538125 RepID=A0AAV4N298_9ARAC|nr:hypothetical protein CDAR_286051 [Caerostris darwini]
MSQSLLTGVMTLRTGVVEQGITCVVLFTKRGSKRSLETNPMRISYYLTFSMQSPKWLQFHEMTCTYINTSRPPDCIQPTLYRTMKP